jgi:plasmid stabilization system protein ParE
VRRAIILLPEAVTDVADAYDWYELECPGLGEEFLKCLEDAYDLVAENPQHYPVRFDAFRRILVRRFPYAVYFEFDDKSVVIHYVFHCAQAPDKLSRRLKLPPPSGR